MMLYNHHKFMLLSIISILVVTPNVSALTSQGLSWGYLEEESYTFIRSGFLEQNGASYTTLRQYVLFGPSHPTIEDPMTSESSIPRVSFQEELPNETFVESLFGPREIVAVPVGNWPLLAEVFANHLNTTNSTLQMIETSHEWGYVNLIQDDEISTRTVTLKYSKIDGVLNLFEEVNDYHIIDRYVSNIIDRLDAPTEEPNLLPVLLLLTAIFTVMIVIAIMRMKLR
ncbi:MAG: hypothetical protein ACXADL_13060 [Candidatus Thorarchaeota archaeon]|jgi:hypothetical protein